ncbi:MAG: Crp/Fnr family transcriptional regulator [Desulfobacterales bacterium]|nr:Crp/Fnr family transcriptional regulator [Desulfobacterales bacterium]
MNEFISTISIFEGLPENNVADISEISLIKEFNKNEIIFSEGDKGNGFFVIINGIVKIFKLSPDGKEQILHIFSDGELFGEVPVFSGENFPANAQTISKASLLFLPKDAFIKLISKNPSITINMLSVLCRRLREFAAKIESLSLKDVPSRLSSYILALCDEQSNENIVKLKVSKAQIASIIGTIPETLSRVFAKMASLEIINVDGKKVNILNKKSLKDIAENSLSI